MLSCEEYRKKRKNIIIRLDEDTKILWDVYKAKKQLTSQELIEEFIKSSILEELDEGVK